MSNLPWYVLTCPDCGCKQIYVGNGFYERPNCISCDKELVPFAKQSTAQKLAVITHNPALQNELGTRILDYMYEDSVTEKTLGCAVADAGYAALMDVGHNSGIAASNMFAAIVNMNLDDMIDTMHPVPYTNEDCKY